jgi:signal transduction histidine kinase
LPSARSRGAQADLGNGLKLRAKLLQLEKTLLEAETAQRGYLLSRKAAYLEPFQRSVEAIRPQQRELLDMAFQDKPVRDRLQELSGLIALKLAEMERNIKVASAEEFERTLAVLDSDEGRQMTDKIRKSFAELNGIVSQQMESNTFRWQESMDTSRSAIVTAVGLNVAPDRDARPAADPRPAPDARGHAHAGLARREKLETEVESRTSELSSLSAFLQTNSEREKASLARELHDELGGILTPAKMDLSWLQGRLGSTPEYGERMNRLSKLIDQGIDLKRRIIENLRPSLLDHLGLAPALQWYVDEACKSANLQCNLQDRDNLERLPADLEIALYRVVQESVTNIVKHAQGEAHRPHRRARGRRGCACRSPTTAWASRPGSGEEAVARARRHEPPHPLGARHFDIRSHPGHGTRIDVFVPLEPKEERAASCLVREQARRSGGDGREILALVEEEIRAGLEGRDLERGTAWLVSTTMQAACSPEAARRRRMTPKPVPCASCRSTIARSMVWRSHAASASSSVARGGDHLDAVGHRHQLDQPLGDLRGILDDQRLHQFGIRCAGIETMGRQGWRPGPPSSCVGGGALLGSRPRCMFRR